MLGKLGVTVQIPVIQLPIYDGIADPMTIVLIYH